jgi:hypothetical protein
MTVMIGTTLNIQVLLGSQFNSAGGKRMLVRARTQLGRPGALQSSRVLFVSGLLILRTEIFWAGRFEFQNQLGPKSHSQNLFAYFSLLYFHKKLTIQIQTLEHGSSFSEEFTAKLFQKSAM